jgi:hypothetical protein
MFGDRVLAASLDPENLREVIGASHYPRDLLMENVPPEDNRSAGTRRSMLENGDRLRELLELRIAHQ